MKPQAVDRHELVLWLRWPGHSGSAIVSTTALARAGRKHRLADYAILGKGIQPDKLPASVLANLVESLIAAAFLDGGLEEARVLVESMLVDEIDAALQGTYEKNFKSLLQQHVQRKLGQAPQYRLVSETGPEHGKTFQVAAVIAEVAYPPGEGPTKKAAEQRAAARALACLGQAVSSTSEDDDSR